MTNNSWQVAILAMTIVAIPLSALHAVELRKLDGDYIVAPQNGNGPVEFGLVVRGSAAQDIYTNLDLKEQVDPCTGGLMKSEPQGIHCIKDAETYSCSLGYVLKTRKTTAGPLSC